MVNELAMPRPTNRTGQADSSAVKLRICPAEVGSAPRSLIAPKRAVGQHRVADIIVHGPAVGSTATITRSLIALKRAVGQGRAAAGIVDGPAGVCTAATTRSLIILKRAVGQGRVAIRIVNGPAGVITDPRSQIALKQAVSQHRVTTVTVVHGTALVGKAPSSLIALKGAVGQGRAAAIVVHTSPKIDTAPSCNHKAIQHGRSRQTQTGGVVDYPAAIACQRGIGWIT